MGSILRVLAKIQIILEICLIIITTVPKMIQILIQKIKNRHQQPSKKRKKKVRN